jgi:hypothetical protein
MRQKRENAARSNHCTGELELGEEQRPSDTRSSNGTTALQGIRGREHFSPGRAPLPRTICEFFTAQDEV